LEETDDNTCADFVLDSLQINVFETDAAAIRDKLNVTDRLALRDRLQCRSFEWYLDNVWPEHFMPKDDRFFGKVRGH